MMLSLLPMRAEPRLRRWTRAEYYRLAELGLIPERHVELIDGEIFEMSPQGGPHGVGIGLVLDTLQKAFGKGYFVRPQLPVALAPHSEPEPDVAVVRGSPRDFMEHPTSALLVVEVSQSTLAFDSSRKAALYARSGIQEYWIVNLVAGSLDVYRKPLIDAQLEFGGRYAEFRRLLRSDTIVPLAASGASIRVADLLP
jgi:Uma2 family endonuclease